MPGSPAHDLFKALGPIDWEQDLDVNAPDLLRQSLSDIFGHAQCLVDSIPVAAAPAAAKAGRPRSSTDPPPHVPVASPSSQRALDLRKEWKEVKVNSRENPLGLNVYKLAAKDGRGSWFARHSVHEGLSFDKWKLGMEREFAESMKIQGSPGSGNVRGIGAEKRVEDRLVDGCGRMQVYQLSAQFPGPTTPREFVTLLLTADSAVEPAVSASAPDLGTPGKSRFFMVVSKPCLHPECPPRNGYIRGSYESVEFIREVQVGKSVKESQSSTSADPDDSPAAVRGAASSGAGENTGPQQTPTEKSRTSESGQGDEQDTVIEWMMVTRSDPGGNVPRFMVERGTPGGIAGDADKFLKWISSKTLSDFEEVSEMDGTPAKEPSAAEASVNAEDQAKSIPTKNITKSSHEASGPIAEDDDEVPTPMGFYGMISGALGAAASRLPNPWGSAHGDDTSPELSSDAAEDDGTSSIHSFHSFEADQKENETTTGQENEKTKTADANGENRSIHSSTESQENQSAVPSQHEKELQKLEDRRRKMEEKMRQAQEKALAKKSEDASRDEAAMAKLRERHERDMAKQEQKYRRDLEKLEARRAQEQRKAEERRRKQTEREERSNLSLQLDNARAERDLARKQVDLLRAQIGDLQAQNTMLVARLGREGIEAPVAGVGSAGRDSAVVADLQKHSRSASNLSGIGGLKRSVTGGGESGNSTTSSAANSIRTDSAVAAGQRRPSVKTGATGDI